MSEQSESKDENKAQIQISTTDNYLRRNLALKIFKPKKGEIQKLLDYEGFKKMHVSLEIYRGILAITILVIF